MDKNQEYSQKKILIFEGVLNLLQEGRPIHELKVAEIAEASGMGKSTAYEYFSSKEEILREALTYHLRENFKKMVRAVFEAEHFEEMLINALDYLEDSLEKRFTGIFLLMLTDHQGKKDKGNYMDPLMKAKMDTVTMKELKRALAIGKKEGSVSKDITMSDLKMIVMGFFSAYVHELLPLKFIHCGVQAADKPEDRTEEVIELKKRTVHLIMKTLH